MDNKSIAKVFKLYSQLMELHNENPFRIKAIAGASFKIDKLPIPAENLHEEELSKQPGIGKSTAEKIRSILDNGSFSDLDLLLSKTPKGILDMLQIKGLGPKKIQIIWQDLDIESIGELYYACNENRLIEAKGFGLKTQEDIKKAIEFTMANQGWFLYAKVEKAAEIILQNLTKAFPDNKISFTGDFRRKMEIVSSVKIISNIDAIQLTNHLEKSGYQVRQVDTNIMLEDSNKVPFEFVSTSNEHFYRDLLLSTGSEPHTKLLADITDPVPSGTSEEEIYKKLGLDYIEPELREGLDEIEKAKKHQLPTLITYEDLKGSLHNHSTYSDGVHSLEEMAKYCKDTLGLTYFGICDHSKTAVYANGLTVEKLEKQWTEIDQLNQQLAPFKIFKGIESDILGDGSLDYTDDVLSKFDFVVASIHGNLKMDEEKATQRLIRAIENPYTTILGHPTGRLLLSRSGYPIDYKKIIDACATNQVVIEINANPLRLDLDWRWHRYAIEKGVLLSVNPDAHRTEGFHDMRYGVFIARKGGVSPKNCLNAFSLSEIESFFLKKHK